MLHPLNDASFSDPETASSSGASHIPSHPMSIPSRRGMISRDGCLPLDLRNTMGTSGNVSESLLAREWPSSEFLQNPKNLSSSHCGLKPIDTGNIMEHGEGVRREPQSSAKIPLTQWTFSAGRSHSRPKHAQTHHVLQSQCRGSKK